MRANRIDSPIGRALLILPCSGFAKTELENIRRVLEEDHVEVFTAAEESPCHSIEGVEILPDKLTNFARPSEWDAIVFLHSNVTKGYVDNQSLINLARAAWTADRIVASIGTGTIVVANTGLIDEYRVAAAEEQREYLESKGATITQSMALRDNKLITGRDPGATDMFAHLVSGALQGMEK